MGSDLFMNPPPGPRLICSNCCSEGGSLYSLRGVILCAACEHLRPVIMGQRDAQVVHVGPWDEKALRDSFNPEDVRKRNEDVRSLLSSTSKEEARAESQEMRLNEALQSQRKMIEELARRVLQLEQRAEFIRLADTEHGQIVVKAVDEIAAKDKQRDVAFDCLAERVVMLENLSEGAHAGLRRDLNRGWKRLDDLEARCSQLECYVNALREFLSPVTNWIRRNGW